ncbi:MAG: hypothetical protein JWL81_691 [Verrucomicrobiales bacterium]|nr:hypothetical protein [Verrucomicrobiales bacterium]
MGRLIPSARLAAVLLPILFLTGLSSCRLPSAHPGAEARELRRMEQKSVRARLSTDGQRLSLRFLMKGKDAFATVTIGAAANTALTFHPDAKSTAAFLGKSSAEIPVFGPAVWRSVADTLALRLAPASPSQGTLILAGGRELIAHRVRGKGVLTPLAQRPKGLKIVRKISSRELAAEVFTNRADALDRPAGTSGGMILLTGTFPELVYLDRRQHRLVFFCVPLEEAPGLPLAPLSTGTNAVRQLTSFIWRSNILAILKNPVSTTRRMVASGTSMVEAGVGRLLSRLPTGPPPPVAARPDMNPAAWNAELAKIASAPPSAAKLRLRLGGDEFFPEFIQAVQEARRSVDIQIYIFDNDDYAVSVADLLKKRAAENVRVRVLMDESASLTAAASLPESPMPADFSAPDDIDRYLRNDSKVAVRQMPMTGLSASHTKIITVDNEIAWLGGMNIGREYRYDWHDLMIEVRGPLVSWISQDFARAWARHSWGGDFAVARQNWFSTARNPTPSLAPPSVPEGAIPVQPLYTSSRKREIAQAQLAALRRAQRRVWVQNAYLSDDAFITELVNARHRGVDVRVVFPADNDNGVMAANNRALVPLLRRHGVRVFLLPGMSHVKAALYDGWACVGSANFDRLSLRVNNEFSIGFSDKSLVGDLENRLFKTDFQRSREVKSDPPSSPTDELMNALIRSVAGQL